MAQYPLRPAPGVVSDEPHIREGVAGRWVWRRSLQNKHEALAPACPVDTALRQKALQRPLKRCSCGAVTTQQRIQQEAQMGFTKTICSLQ